MTQGILTASRVTEIFDDSLFKSGEDTTNHVVAEGIMTTVGFHPERIASHKEEILNMLHELPKEFQVNSGGGMSFLNACSDRDGQQWTGMQQTMDQLVQLGIGTGQAQYLMPREMWVIFPGSVPYFVVTK